MLRKIKLLREKFCSQRNYSRWFANQSGTFPFSSSFFICPSWIQIMLPIRSGHHRVWPWIPSSQKTSLPPRLNATKDQDYSKPWRKSGPRNAFRWDLACLIFLALHVHSYLTGSLSLTHLCGFLSGGLTQFPPLGLLALIRTPAPHPFLVNKRHPSG